MQQHPQPPTTAILGADTVVGRALCALLEGSGYQTRPLDTHTTGVVGELLEGTDLLLLAPRVDESVREAFLGAMEKSTPQVGEMPVIALTTAVGESPQDERVQSVPWPCETKVLVDHIEAALLDAPSTSAAPALPHLPLKPRRGESTSGAVMSPFEAQESP